MIRMRLILKRLRQIDRSIDRYDQNEIDIEKSKIDR